MILSSTSSSILFVLYQPSSFHTHGRRAEKWRVDVVVEGLDRRVTCVSEPNHTLHFSHNFFLSKQKKEQSKYRRTKIKQNTSHLFNRMQQRERESKVRSIGEERERRTMAEMEQDLVTWDVVVSMENSGAYGWVRCTKPTIMIEWLKVSHNGGLSWDGGGSAAWCKICSGMRNSFWWKGGNFFYLLI